MFFIDLNMAGQIEALSKRYDIPEELVAIASKLDAAYFDFDGTLSEHVVRLKEGEDTLDYFSQIEVENIESIVELAYSGVPVSIVTGRDTTIFPLGRIIHGMIHERIAQVAEKEGRDINDYYFPDGRPKAKNGKPLVFIISHNDGTICYDLFEDQPFYSQELPSEFWQFLLDNPEIGNLLRYSIRDEHFAMTQIVQPDAHRIDRESFQVETIEQLKLWLGDRFLISPFNSRINIGISEEVIMGSPDLADRWEELTGIRIEDEPDATARDVLLVALRKLLEGLNVKFSGQATTPNISIIHADSGKGRSVEEIREHIKRVFKQYGFRRKKIKHELAFGDSPVGNDRELLAAVPRPGGVSLMPTWSGEFGPTYYTLAEKGQDPGSLRIKGMNHLLRMIAEARGI